MAEVSLQAEGCWVPSDITYAIAPPSGSAATWNRLAQPVRVVQSEWPSLAVTFSWPEERKLRTSDPKPASCKMEF